MRRSSPGRCPGRNGRGSAIAQRLSSMLGESALAVRDAVKRRLESGREMDLHYDHPILMVQHLI